MNAASLRVRVSSWYSGVLAVALILLGCAVWLGVRNYLVSALKETLRDQSANITDEFVSRVDQKSVRWLDGEMEEAYAPARDTRYMRIVRNGVVLYQSKNPQPHAISDWTRATPGAQPGDGAFEEIRLASGERILLYSRVWVSPAGAQFLVQTGAPTEPVDRVTRTLLIALCLLTPLILVGAAVGGYLLMNVPFRPIVALTTQAEQIGTRALGERLPVIPTGDELERLSVSLNRMIERLEDAVAHNRRFSDDVSHELRTPLTILRGELEPLVEDPKLDPNVLDSIGSALEEIERMSDIVENLLAISKLDFRNSIPRVPVNLKALALSTVDQMQLLADDKDLRVQASVNADTWVPGDRIRLQQMIVNLLDNAFKYTPANGDVALSVFAESNHGVLEIRDTGIGIPQDCLPFVFDRFYRADKARSRESGGTGLGLSIVKAICTAHDGTVSIQSREGAGTTVRVELPLCTEEELANFREAGPNVPTTVEDIIDLEGSMSDSGILKET